SSYGRPMIELRTDVELKDTIMVVMPKLTREGFYTCIFHVEYEWKPLRCACCKLVTEAQFRGLILDGCKTLVSTWILLLLKKFRKLENLIIDRKVTLVDDDGKPLKKVDYPGDYNSEDEVESVDNDMARSMASESISFGTKSLLEQWRDTHENGDYDEDPYVDDMYEGQDLPQDLRYM
ncbi:hypothetical protein Tco_0337374, partial [Tanacetum coccineum]